ncbi:30S ribosomal protein S19 [Candidatus Peribacteria bacterium RIFCSPHIGHO2_01_FULL_51_9]|nr:MAG: 30S ribosomal protein S19 [Candidatus Peribacteria bacterium RIFCSPHIGHO2_01_FULL_51_9]
MSRSLKKGPYIEPKLLKKVMRMIEAGQKQIIKTWARRSDIPPEFVGFTFAVHNGKEFTPVYITEQMVGHKLGEFSWTTKFKAHSGKMADAQAQAKTAAPSVAAGPSPTPSPK